MKYRIEYDSLGKIKVPGDKYWGASTQRSNKYFDIGDFLVRPILIHSIAIIKKAAAIVNSKNGDLDKKLKKYIINKGLKLEQGINSMKREFWLRSLLMMIVEGFYLI